MKSLESPPEMFAHLQLVYFVLKSNISGKSMIKGQML